MNNYIFINELPELQDIIDELVFEDEPSIFDEVFTLDLVESALNLMEDYIMDNPTAITEPDFEEIFLEDIKELFYIQFEEEILNSDFVEDDLNDILEDVFQIFITTFYPERSQSFLQENTVLVGNDKFSIDEKQIIQDKINFLKSKPQPEQRTEEWYLFRHNLITASNAYKVFDSQATINQLIYEKCKPLKYNNEEDDKVKMVNINTPFHWGQKYEPVSVMIYEHLYKTKIDDFGCIQHDKYKFLGASPDGINVDQNSERFGRMLEIKNIVNREINGIPKKEYWIQMQLQMEVCDLNECDFLETKFIEYENASDFFETNNEITQENMHKKGVILYFHNSEEGKPFYVYKPIYLTNSEDILKWEEEKIDLYLSPQHNLIYVKSIYWKLEILSCVLVLRNKNWFENNIKSIEKVWNIIEKERITGYEHRIPIKKPKKENISTNQTKIDDFFNGTNGCLISIKK
jgi:putative phage-type endonuclease